MKDLTSLLRHPAAQGDAYQRVTASDANWQTLNFEARLLNRGETWEGHTGENEYAFVLLSGNYKVDTDRGSWETLDGRKDVFSGMAHTLYLPRNTSFTLVATSDLLDVAAGWCVATADFPPVFKQPAETAIEIRGGDHATRQINSLVEPGFPCSRIVSVEVYTPSGNWSSFPAHKHDERTLGPDGQLKEACLEEVYFYKFQKSQGYAIQQVYTADGSLNELMQVRHNDLVLVPKGYHPVSAAPGYHCYYLNFLAGSDQSLANTSDPDHEWIFDSWKETDSRLPLVNAGMNGSFNI